MKTNAEIRAAARRQLGGGIFAENWLMGLVLVVIEVLVAGLTSSLIGLLIIGPIIIGIASIYLGLARGRIQKVDLAGIGYGFEGGSFVRCFLLYLLQGLYLLLWYFVFVIPAIVKSYSYRLAHYIAIERPDLSPNECITESRRLMNGHKMQAFLLDLSFLGWLILGYLACCVGVLFVIPYMESARANFYTAIIEQEEPITVSAEDVPDEGSSTEG